MKDEEDDSQVDREEDIKNEEEERRYEYLIRTLNEWVIFKAE